MDIEDIIHNPNNSRIKALYRKTKNIFSKFYPEFLIPGYVALTSWFVYKNDLLRKPMDASLEDSIIWGVECGAVLYLGLATHRSKSKVNKPKPLTEKHDSSIDELISDKKPSIPSTEQNQSPKQILQISSVTGIGVWSCLFLPRIFEKINLLSNPSGKLWEEYLIKYDELIMQFSELGFNSDYRPYGLLHELLISQTMAASVMIPAYLSAAYFIIDFTKALWDNNQAKYLKANLKIIGNFLLKKYDRALDAVDELEKISIYNAIPHLYRADIYYNLGKYKYAILESKKAREKSEYQDHFHVDVGKYDLRAKVTWLSQFVRRLSFKKKLKKLKNSTQNNQTGKIEEIASRFCNLAYMCLLSNMPKKALSILREANELFPHNLDIMALYVQELEMQEGEECKQNALDLHKTIWFELKDNPQYHVDSCGETTKKVMVVSNVSSPLLSNVYIYKKDTPEESIKASENLRSIQSAKIITIEDLVIDIETSLSKNDLEEAKRLFRIKTILGNLNFTEEIGQVVDQDQVVSIMNRAIGGTLRDQLVNGPIIITDIYDILTSMAFIHAKMSKSERTVRDKKEYFISRVEQLTKLFSFSDDIYESLIQGYVVDNYLDFDYVFNKDSHPENWVLDVGLIPGLRDKKITAIDWDEKGLVHQTSELVNLLDTFTCFSYVFKKMFVSHYIMDYLYFKDKSTPGKSDINRFMVSCLNTSYSRAIELFYAWSDESRPSMYSYRELLLKNALYSTKQIRLAHPNFYNQHNGEYAHRLKAVNQLLTFLPQ